MGSLLKREICLGLWFYSKVQSSQLIVFVANNTRVTQGIRGCVYECVCMTSMCMLYAHTYLCKCVYVCLFVCVPSGLFSIKSLGFIHGSPCLITLIQPPPLSPSS